MELDLCTGSQVIFTISREQIVSLRAVSVLKITKPVSANNSIENMFRFCNIMFRLAAFLFLLGGGKLKYVKGLCC